MPKHTFVDHPLRGKVCTKCSVPQVSIAARALAARAGAAVPVIGDKRSPADKAKDDMRDALLSNEDYCEAGLCIRCKRSSAQLDTETTGLDAEAGVCMVCRRAGVPAP